ncbi:uncharacterized protein LODBEIA_P05550 [Lodderomyces beijingensis]|uniref:Mannosyltransferase n=1 Tax=Lodderomyces beijingensis TaxID=1775926 RepID=A0ABP0ZHN0_9ASCO
MPCETTSINTRSFSYFTDNRHQEMKLTRLQHVLVALNVAYRLYSAFYMIVGDCDETFNYWEPLNLLLRHFGKETWEYSPEYSIRSYAYLMPYYILGKIAQSLQLSPKSIFYFIRAVGLSGFTSFCEIRFFLTIAHYSSDVANWFLLFSSLSPGMSHGGVALLPSSLALQTTILAHSYILKATKAANSHKMMTRYLLGAIGCYFVGGILGWPFALALGIPVGFYTVAQIARKLISPTILLKIAIVAGCIVAPIVAIDSYFLQKLVFIPANIVLYNVFGGEGEGPEIFGVEPWSYYVLNLALNFHVVLPLSVAGALCNPLLAGKLKLFSLLVSAQLLVWNVIFFSQPHKEERFMYPIYGLISISAAIFVSQALRIGEKGVAAIKPIRPMSLTPALRLGLIMAVAVPSHLRILNLVENYGAPLRTFSYIADLQPQPIDDGQLNVCMGKEWYHFPNSFFLPDGYRLKFVDSGFDGLLPGDFLEQGSIRDSASHVPPNMNSRNEFEADKIVELKECDYFVDNSQLGSKPQLLYPDLTLDQEWELKRCYKMINPDGRHTFLGKLLYIPTTFLKKVLPSHVESMSFCVLKRKDE